jgi:hypothetical protein
VNKNNKFNKKISRMNIKGLIYPLISFKVIITVLSSCEKDYNNNQMKPSELNDIKDLTLKEKSELIENYAIALAASVADKELRAVIKKEAQLMFDGDYDILTCRLEEMLLPTQQMVIKDLFIASYNEKIYSSNNLKSCHLEGNDFLVKINRTFPNLQVSVPIHCDSWDTEKHTPLVVYLPYNFDESKSEFVFAYDADGIKHKLSLDEEPSEPVLVIGISERIDINGKKIGIEPHYLNISSGKSNSTMNYRSSVSSSSELNISHGPAQTIILEWSDAKDEIGYELWRMLQPGETQFYQIGTTTQNDNGFVNKNIKVGAKVWYKVRAINEDGYSPWSPIMATTVSPRDDGEWLKISRMQFSKSALKAVESWVSGAPELRLRVIQGSENGASIVFTSGRMEPKKRSDILNKWWANEIQLFTWHTSTYGTVLTFDWQEEDNVSKLTFTVNASYEAKKLGGSLKAGGNVKFTVDKNGSIGNTSVMWWHERDQVYDLSGFKWQFEH